MAARLIATEPSLLNGASARFDSTTSLTDMQEFGDELAARQEQRLGI